LTVNSAVDATLASAITGGTSALFNKNGAGTLTLTGTNTFAGTVNVLAGTLQIGNGGTTGTYAGNISSAGTVIFNRSDNYTYAGQISGSGVFIKQGAGTLTVTGASSAGTVTIAAGTLQWGDGVTGGYLIPTAAGIVDNGTLALNLPGSANFTFDVSGTGAVRMDTGSGVLFNAWSQTGGTTLSAGTTLFVGAGGTTGSVAGNILNNGTLIFNRSDAPTVAGIIAGTGSLIQGGSGNLILTGANTYTGGTTISAGTLQIGNGGTTGSITGNVADNGVLVFNRSDSVTFANVISGTGSVAQAGTGTTILTGANTYTGNTTVTAGTLQVGAGGTSGGIASNVTDNGALVFNRSDSVTFAKVVSGTGSVTQAGTGTIVLTGANTYSGGTVISAGTLQIGNGGVAGTIGTGAIADNGVLSFNHSDSVTVAGAISGTGSLIQNGGGNLILAGVSTFSGPALINAGTLSVNGSMASSVTVNSGGKLGGTGTVGATTVASGGSIAPGNSIGTLHVNGNLTLAPGSTTAIEISPTAADQIVVSGTAALGGTLAFNQGAGGYTAGTDFKLITASAVNGVFSNITGLNVAGLDANVTYSATAVDLTLATPAASGGSGGGSSGSGSTGGGGTGGGSSGGGGTVTNSFLFNTYGKTPNQIAAGAALTAGSNTGALYVATGNLVAANVASVPGTLGQMAGDIHASIRGAAVEDSRIIRDAVLGRLDQGSERAIVWGSAFGGYGSIAGDGNAAALHHDSAGFIAGADMPVSDGIRLGIAAAYSTDRASTSGHLSTASGNNGHVIGYAGWTSDAFDLKLGGDYGWGTIHTARQVTALGQTLAGRQDQRMAQVFADAGYRIASDQWLFEPYVDIAHVEATSGSFAEHGGSAALSGGSVTDGLTYGTLGLRAALAGISLEDIGIAPKLDLGWRHAFDALKPGQMVSFQDTGTSFAVLGVPLDTDAAALQVGFDVALTPDAKLSLGYDGTFGSRVQNNAVRGVFQWAF
jgi:fibronectin-binding autotransporter adhesin